MKNNQTRFNSSDLGIQDRKWYDRYCQITLDINKGVFLKLRSAEYKWFKFNEKKLLEGKLCEFRKTLFKIMYIAFKTRVDEKSLDMISRYKTVLENNPELGNSAKRKAVIRTLPKSEQRIFVYIENQREKYKQGLVRESVCREWLKVGINLKLCSLDDWGLMINIFNEHLKKHKNIKRLPVKCANWYKNALSEFKKGKLSNEKSLEIEGTLENLELCNEAEYFETYRHFKALYGKDNEPDLRQCDNASYIMTWQPLIEHLFKIKTLYKLGRLSLVKQRAWEQQGYIFERVTSKAVNKTATSHFERLAS